ncbi:UNVERIFIED_CONTAM: hypothetical protein Slati_2418000, partial [Sesamum latifolium]
MSKNPLTLIMDTNKFNGTNYTDWLRNLRIVLDFENQGYVLDKPLPTALPEGSSPEERLTFDKWLEDNRKVRNIILISMTNEIQKQYDKLDDVPSIMLRMKQERLRPPRRKARVPNAGREKRARDRLSQPLLAPEAPLLPQRERAKGRLGVLNGRGQMMYACIAKERGIGRGSVHNFSSTQVLERSIKLSKDEMVLRLGDGKAVAVEAVGSLSLIVSNHVRIELKDYFYVPIMIKNIISIPLLDSDGFKFLINKSCFYLMVDDEHHLLGHISKDRIRKLVDSKNLEIDDLNHLPTCESCLKGKMTKKPFVGQSAIANGLLDLVHTDVCGPLSTPARGEFSYFITFTNDHSRYGYVYLMRYKSEAFGRFKEYRLEVENQTNRKIKVLWSDQGAPSKMVSQTPYEIWHGKPASYKYLRVWGSPAYVKRLVGDKLDSRSSLCKFIRYPKETAGYYFYDLATQKIFVSRNAVFLEKGFSSDSRRDEALIEESSEEPQHDSTTSFEPMIHTDGVPVLRRSTRESRVPERYEFVGLTSQLYNNPKMYGEAMLDIDSDKWLEAMKSKKNSMGLNQVWTVVDPPKGVRPVGCKWVYKHVMVVISLRALAEVLSNKAPPLAASIKLLFVSDNPS